VKNVFVADIADAVNELLQAGNFHEFLIEPQINTCAALINRGKYRNDPYIAGKKLPAHNKKDAPRRNYFDKVVCQSCAHRGNCIRGNRPYRKVTKNQYAEIYEEVDKRIRENLHLYKLRQQIVKHPFGTIKFGLQGHYFLLRTRRKVRAEVALLFLSYNLKRAAKAHGFDELMRKLGEEKRFFCLLACFQCKQLQLLNIRVWRFILLEF
jgi:hypothetical protein